MKRLFPLSIALLVMSCASGPEQQYTYTTSEAEIAEARQKFRQSDYNFLSLLLVDRDGRVVEVRKLSSKFDSPRQERKVKKALYGVRFTRAPPDDGNPYREFVFPFKADTGRGTDTNNTARTYEPNEFILRDDW